MEELKRKDNRKSLIVIGVILILIVTVIGYTYSFFQIEKTNTGSITGTVATTGLTVSVNKVAPSTNVGLVPQLDSAIASAVIGTNNKSCVDANNNEVCQVYSITVKNTSTYSVNVYGLLELDAGDNPNLKWTRISNPAPTKPTVESSINSYTTKTLTTNETYNANQEKIYYIVVWISELNESQDDTGVFTGTVTFYDSNSGPKEDLAFATLTSLGLDDDYRGDAKPGLFDGFCMYDGNPVYGAFNSGENCSMIVKVTDYDGNELYLDAMYGQFLISAYQGKGTWDSNESVCLYNNIPVFDYNQNFIASAENCGDVYNVGPLFGTEIAYVSIILEVLEGEGTGTTVGIYSSDDDLGTSYFFRKDSENNYVKFGKWSDDTPDVYYDSYGNEYFTPNECSGCELISRAGKDMYWRIVRINGDGTVRMFYYGTVPPENKSWSDYDSFITFKAFNIQDTDNAFVGYMNGTLDGINFPNGTTKSIDYIEAHSNNTNSTIKNYLENVWYESNIKGTNYEQYVSDAIYCNDRSIYKGTGVGKSDTSYGFLNRDNGNFLTGTVRTPTLKCLQPNDRFSYQSTSIGGVATNGKLNAPVGLITADEVLMVSGFGEPVGYLATGFDYWSMTPGGLVIDRFADVLGGDGYGVVSNNYGVIPVITLKADALKYTAISNGTMEHPFTVTG